METFVKYNNSGFKDALIKEAEGLRLLKKNLSSNSYLNTPKIIDESKDQLVLEKIASKGALKEQAIELGKGLALLHKQRFESYGLDGDNYIGLNPQKNILSKDWGGFFIDYRLGFQIALIKDDPIKNRFEAILKNNFSKLQTFLNETCDHPSLVHGDLWSGNVLYSEDKVWLIDPAVYYGDREVDIAMSEMFGGFKKEFYGSYNETYPLNAYYDKKRVIYNLYHYLNHYNLFGFGYLSSCGEGFAFIEKL